MVGENVKRRGASDNNVVITRMFFILLGERESSELSQTEPQASQTADQTEPQASQTADQTATITSQSNSCITYRMFKYYMHSK